MREYRYYEFQAIDRPLSQREGALRGVAALPGKLCQHGYAAGSMPTRNISLTPAQDAFVAKVVAEGEYQNASEAVRDALRVLQQRRREDELKLKALQAQLQAGIDALDRGDYVELDDPDIERYLASTPARQRKRMR